MPHNPFPKRYMILFRAKDLASLNSLYPDNLDQAVKHLGYFGLLDSGEFAFYNSITKQYELLKDSLGDINPLLALNDLTDVTIDNPQPGQALIYNGVEWINTTLSTGIMLARSKAHYHMSGNTTATIVSVSGDYYKVAGTTTSVIAQDFILTNNKATYTGSQPKTFKVGVGMSITDGANKVLNFRFKKNNLTLSDGQVTLTSHSPSEPVSSYLQDIITLNTGDFIELYATNLSSTSNITVIELSVILEEF